MLKFILGHLTLIFLGLVMFLIGVYRFSPGSDTGASRKIF